MDGGLYEDKQRLSRPPKSLVSKPYVVGEFIKNEHGHYLKKKNEPDKIEKQRAMNTV